VYDLMAAYLPRLQSDNKIYIQQDVRTHITTIEDVSRKPEIARVQPPTHHIGPFRFLDLEPSIRTRILQFIFHHKDISPTYNAGSVQVPERLTQDNQNIDTSLLLVNKQLYTEASRILYTENTFSFTNPAVALWFLQRIGPNLANLRSANFALDSGEANEAFGVRKEKIWLILFTWLKPRHKLQNLVISFRNWRNIRDHIVERDCVTLLLSSYRGLEQVIIKSLECSGRYDADCLKRAMLMKEGETWPGLEKMNRDCGRGRSTYRSR
jgi:hypothetical protein